MTMLNHLSVDSSLQQQRPSSTVPRRSAHHPGPQEGGRECQRWSLEDEIGTWHSLGFGIPYRRCWLWTMTWGFCPQRQSPEVPSGFTKLDEPLIEDILVNSYSRITGYGNTIALIPSSPNPNLEPDHRQWLLTMNLAGDIIGASRFTYTKVIEFGWNASGTHLIVVFEDCMIRVFSREARVVAAIDLIATDTQPSSSLLSTTTHQDLLSALSQDDSMKNTRGGPNCHGGATTLSNEKNYVLDCPVHRGKQSSDGCCRSLSSDTIVLAAKVHPLYGVFLVTRNELPPTDVATCQATSMMGPVGGSDGHSARPLTPKKQYRYHVVHNRSYFTKAMCTWATLDKEISEDTAPPGIALMTLLEPSVELLNASDNPPTKRDNGAVLTGVRPSIFPLPTFHDFAAKVKISEPPTTKRTAKDTKIQPLGGLQLRILIVWTDGKATLITGHRRLVQGSENSQLGSGSVDPDEDGVASLSNLKSLFETGQELVDIAALGSHVQRLTDNLMADRMKLLWDKESTTMAGRPCEPVTVTALPTIVELNLTNHSTNEPNLYRRRSQNHDVGTNSLCTGAVSRSQRFLALQSTGCLSIYPIEVFYDDVAIWHHLLHGHTSTLGKYAIQPSAQAETIKMNPETLAWVGDECLALTVLLPTPAGTPQRTFFLGGPRGKWLPLPVIDNRSLHLFSLPEGCLLLSSRGVEGIQQVPRSIYLIGSLGSEHPSAILWYACRHIESRSAENHNQSNLGVHRNCDQPGKLNSLENAMLTMSLSDFRTALTTMIAAAENEWQMPIASSFLDVFHMGMKIYLHRLCYKNGLNKGDTNRQRERRQIFLKKTITDAYLRMCKDLNVVSTDRLLHEPNVKGSYFWGLRSVKHFREIGPKNLVTSAALHGQLNVALRLMDHSGLDPQDAALMTASSAFGNNLKYEMQSNEFRISVGLGYALRLISSPQAEAYTDDDLEQLINLAMGIDSTDHGNDKRSLLLLYGHHTDKALDTAFTFLLEESIAANRDSLAMRWIKRLPYLHKRIFLLVNPLENFFEALKLSLSEGYLTITKALLLELLKPSLLVKRCNEATDESRTVVKKVVSYIKSFSPRDAHLKQMLIQQLISLCSSLDMPYVARSILHQSQQYLESASLLFENITQSSCGHVEIGSGYLQPMLPYHGPDPGPTKTMKGRFSESCLPGGYQWQGYGVIHEEHCMPHLPLCFTTQPVHQVLCDRPDLTANMTQGIHQAIKRGELVYPFCSTFGDVSLLGLKRDAQTKMFSNQTRNGLSNPLDDDVAMTKQRSTRRSSSDGGFWAMFGSNSFSEKDKLQGSPANISTIDDTIDKALTSVVSCYRRGMLLSGTDQNVNAFTSSNGETPATIWKWLAPTTEQSGNVMSQPMAQNLVSCYNDYFVARYGVISANMSRAISQQQNELGLKSSLDEVLGHASYSFTTLASTMTIVAQAGSTSLSLGSTVAKDIYTAAYKQPLFPARPGGRSSGHLSGGGGGSGVGIHEGNLASWMKLQHTLMLSSLLEHAPRMTRYTNGRTSQLTTQDVAKDRNAFIETTLHNSCASSGPSPFHAMGGLINSMIGRSGNAAGWTGGAAFALSPRVVLTMLARLDHPCTEDQYELTKPYIEKILSVVTSQNKDIRERWAQWAGVRA